MQEIGSDLNTFWTAINEDLQVNVKASVTLGNWSGNFGVNLLGRVAEETVHFTYEVVIKRSVNFVDCWPQWLCHGPPGASAYLWRDSSTLSCTSPLDRHTCTVTQRLR